MSEQETKNNMPVYSTEHVSSQPGSHLKDFLELANAINTAVAEGKVVLIEHGDITHVTQIAGAFSLYTHVVCIQHCPFPRDYSSEIPAVWLQSGDAVTAHYAQSTNVEVLCAKYVDHNDRWRLRKIT
jgi:hypothetical protein